MFGPTKERRVNHVTEAKLCFFLLLAGCAASIAIAETQEPPVKLSRNGICHERGTSSYGATLHYESFDTLADCIKAGGHARKTKHEAPKPVAPGSDPSIEKHDSQSPGRITKWLERLPGGPIPYVAGTILVIISLVAFMWRRRIRGGRAIMPPSSDPTAEGAALFKSLLGGDEPKQAPPKHTTKVTAATGWSAAQLLAATQQLQAADAQWPVILATLNPKGDQVIQKMLLDLKGPHLFAPHVALNAIAEGAERVLAANERADARDALREALRTTNRIVE
jgi:hypothetical protein